MKVIIPETRWVSERTRKKRLSLWRAASFRHGPGMEAPSEPCPPRGVKQTLVDTLLTQTVVTHIMARIWA